MSAGADHPALAAIHYERGFDIDGLLMAACARLRAAGVHLGGLLQEASGERGACAASVKVVDLRSGKAFNIWEPRGACARGCRLDERGLLDAEPALMMAVAERVDLLVVNRFGRAESLGRGLTAVFSVALEAGVPVLTAVRSPYDEAWSRFHGGLGKLLRCELDAALEWFACRTGRREERMNVAAPEPRAALPGTSAAAR